MDIQVKKILAVVGVVALMFALGGAVGVTSVNVGLCALVGFGALAVAAVL